MSLRQASGKRWEVCNPTLANSSSQTQVDQRVWYLSGKLRPNDPVREIPLSAFPFRVGRRSDLSLPLPVPTVSGVHAEIDTEQDQLVLRDLGSTNGTFLNGERISEPQILHQNDLIQFANIPFRLGRRSADCTATIQHDVFSEVAALVQFDKLLQGSGLTPFYQPIVELEHCRIVAYEVLARSSLDGLKTPADMFHAASQLNSEVELSQILRLRGLAGGEEIGAEVPLFVNTHPKEMMDEEGFFESLKEVRRRYEDQAIVVEIHESSVSNPDQMKRLRSLLNDLDIGLAYDDFGAGQARLTELIEVQPDWLKFDRSLVRNIDRAPSQHLEALASLLMMTHRLGVISLAEGVETAGEHEVCQQLGFQQGQGFFYGHPAPLGR